MELLEKECNSKKNEMRSGRGIIYENYTRR